MSYVCDTFSFCLSRRWSSPRWSPTKANHQIQPTGRRGGVVPLHWGLYCKTLHLNQENVLEYFSLVDYCSHSVGKERVRGMAAWRCLCPWQCRRHQRVQLQHTQSIYYVTPTPPSPHPQPPPLANYCFFWYIVIFFHRRRISAKETIHAGSL